MHDSKKGCVPMNPGITLSKSQCPTSDLEVAMMSSNDLEVVNEFAIIVI